MAQNRSLKSNKKLRTGALAVIAVIAVGAAYTAAAGDLVYSAQSMLAAITTAVDTTPRIVITRNAYSSVSTFPTDGASVATFDVSPKYLTSYGYLRQVNTSVVIETSTSGLKLSGSHFKMRYEYCVSSACRVLPVQIESFYSTTTKIGRTRWVLNSPSNLNLPVYMGQPAGRLFVTAYPYYPSYYNAVDAPTTRIKADVDSAYGAGRLCSFSSIDGSYVCKYPSVKVGTALAYGNWVKVHRGLGYGYGYYDFTQNGQLNRLDAELLAKVAVRSISCPIFKVCNVDGKLNAVDGRAVDTADVLLLSKYFTPAL